MSCRSRNRYQLLSKIKFKYTVATQVMYEGKIGNYPGPPPPLGVTCRATACAFGWQAAAAEAARKAAEASPLFGDSLSPLNPKPH